MNNDLPHTVKLLKRIGRELQNSYGLYEKESLEFLSLCGVPESLLFDSENWLDENNTPFGCDRDGNDDSQLNLLLALARYVMRGPEDIRLWEIYRNLKDEGLTIEQGAE